VSGVAESLFATLFPSDCPLCGSPLVNISRLSVCQPCLAVRPVSGNVCSVCKARVFSPYALGSSENRCGLCRRLDRPFVQAVAYGSYDGGLRELIRSVSITVGYERYGGEVE
jgi:predicted amidophosphoribosyltransferase